MEELRLYLSRSTASLFKPTRMAGTWVDFNNAVWLFEYSYPHARGEHPPLAIFGVMYVQAMRNPRC